MAGGINACLFRLELRVQWLLIELFQLIDDFKTCQELAAPTKRYSWCILPSHFTTMIGGIAGSR
jgi:hypothetical protein